uniref:Uncharacterized protein n=1 Tax=Noccaea caerulescens TaxID=107243 RepID=A0A1J3JQC9_NOCCA
MKIILSFLKCLLDFLGKVGETSHTDLKACIVACKTFQSISKYPDVLMKLNLEESFPPPWNRIPFSYFNFALSQSPL